MIRDGQPMPPLRICEGCPATACDVCPVTTDPERWRRMEREDRNTLRVLVVASFLVVVLLAGFTYLAWQNHQVLASHSDDLARTEQIVRGLAAQQDSASTNHTQTLGVLAAICVDLHITCPGIASGNSAATP